MECEHRREISRREVENFLELLKYGWGLQQQCFKLLRETSNMIKGIRHLLQSKQFHDFFLYVVVGGLATIVEWVAFWVLENPMHIQYLVSTALAFVFSTFANWFFGRLLVFKSGRGSFLREIISVYLASVIGLLLNLLIMFILVQNFTINKMPSKIAATAIVFIYNYLVRKQVIYKKKESETAS